MAKNLKPHSQESVFSDLIEDLHALAQLLPVFLKSIEPDVWQEGGGQRQGNEWTLHQTVAHLAAVAEFYRSALQLALLHETLVFPGFQQRSDLPAVNQREIQERQHFRPSMLIATLQQALAETIEIAQRLVPEQLSWPVPVPVFNRTMTVFEVLEMQVMHPGMVHAAQIARPAGRFPLWREYDTPLMHRMLARWFRLLSLTYWPERGGKLRATFQFRIAGVAGGEWYVSVSPERCWSGEGRAPKPQVIFWSANADALCRLFTGQISIVQALLHRQLFMRGNLLLATRLASFFSPT